MLYQISALSVSHLSNEICEPELTAAHLSLSLFFVVLCYFSLSPNLLCLPLESEKNAASFKGSERLSHWSTLLKIRLCNSLTHPVPERGINPLISWLARCLAAVLGHAFHSDKSQQSFISAGHWHSMCRLKPRTHWLSNGLL